MLQFGYPPPTTYSDYGKLYLQELTQNDKEIFECNFREIFSKLEKKNFQGKGKLYEEFLIATTHLLNTHFYMDFNIKNLEKVSKFSQKIEGQYALVSNGEGVVNADLKKGSGLITKISQNIYRASFKTSGQVLLSIDFGIHNSSFPGEYSIEYLVNNSPDAYYEKYKGKVDNKKIKKIKILNIYVNRKAYSRK